MTDFYFEGSELKSKIKYFGAEKGFELEDKLTIILAKSNFIIYMSELVKSNPTLTKEFSKKYNEIFKIYTSSILGSLSEIKDDGFDLIMSNPPYVTRGVSNYKEAIINNSKLSNRFSINAMGLEGLFLEKICKDLKVGGKGIIILPEGIFYRENDKKIRDYLLHNFNIEAIVSLPSNTFYTTPQKTYILSIVKKAVKGVQEEPVFTYFVNEIGETKDRARIPIANNDLKDMVKQFKYFLTDKLEYKPINFRCKIFPISEFEHNPHWLIDKWLSDEELKDLGIQQNSLEIKSISEFSDDLMNILKIIESNKTKIRELEDSFSGVNYKHFSFDDIFHLDDGYSFQSSIYTSSKTDIKLIRIQDINKKSEIKEVRIPLNYSFNKTNRKDIERLQERYWVTKGDFLISLSGAAGFHINKYQGEEGYLNQRIVRVRLKDQYKKKIKSNYIPVIFKDIKIELNKEGFGANNNLNKTTLKKVEIKVPINDQNELDIDKQNELANNLSFITDLKLKLKNSLSIISNTEIDFGNK